jgi:hypothetical protein
MKKKEKMNREEKEFREIEKLCFACCVEEWDVAKAMITKNPLLVYKDTPHCLIPAIGVSLHDKVEMLQYIEDAIFAFSLQHPHPQQQQLQRQMMRDAFEGTPPHRDTPAHTAARHGSVLCLAFLAEHAPSGAAILEVKYSRGITPVYDAASEGQMEALGFIARNAPTGLEVLEVKTNWGRTPLDEAIGRKKQRVVEYIEKRKALHVPLSSSSSFSSSCSFGRAESC